MPLFRPHCFGLTVLATALSMAGFGAAAAPTYEQRRADVVQAEAGRALADSRVGSPAYVVTSLLRNRGRDAATLATMRQADTRSGRGGVQHVRFEQSVDGLAVHGGYVKAAFDRQGKLIQVIDGLARVPAGPMRPASVDALQALRAAMGRVHPGVVANFVQQSSQGAVTVFDGGAFFDEAPTVTAVAVPLSDGSLARGFLVETWSLAGNQLHHTLVGGDGAVLHVEKRTASDTYNVFTVDPGKGPQTVVNGPGAGNAESPAGWLAGRSELTTNITGNNVSAYLDSDANNRPDSGGTRNGTGNFLTTVDLGAASTTTGNKAGAVQNLFRMYPKLAGMTGTAMTEASEFGEIYKLEVVEIPTNVDVARKDADDEIYRTLGDKTRAIVKLIEECRARQQPMLVGTVSIEKSEALSDELKKRSIPHNVLNARYHEQEAEIVAQAGRPGSVTIATNMAGRGTDIQLGGNADMLVRHAEAEIANRVADEAARQAEIEKAAATIKADVARDREIVRGAGGLYVVGTERHESRRIDNQLRGRSGRQGDPGASKFFLSLEDDLMRIFGNNKVLDWVQKKGMADDEALTHRWLNKALETAQGKVEARNFEIRKNLLRFDDVMNAQRQEIYKERIELMGTEDVSETVAGMRRDVVDALIRRTIPEGVYAEQWKVGELKDDVQRIFGLDLPVDEWAREEGIADEEIKVRLNDAVDRVFAQKAAQYGPDVWRQVEKSVLMQIFDQSWKDHLLHLDHLRQGIGLRAYGQKDPLNEYKREAFNLFSDLLTNLREQVVTLLATLQIRMEAPPMPEMPSDMHEVHEDPALAASMSDDPAYDPADPDGGGVATLHRPRPVAKGPVDPNDPSTWGKVSRNAACPCGSGKKFKHCHGRV